MRFAYAAIIALVAAVFLPYSAAAAQISDGYNVAAARADAERQLVAMGINAGDATFQVGARNYAGPNCPGAGWNCTTATTVVQIGTRAAFSANYFACSANTPTSTGSNPCTIVQLGPGPNDARCIQYSTNPGATQTCDITQTSAGEAKNSAFVGQLIDQSQGTAATPPTVEQKGMQTANVTQSGVAGLNFAAIGQEIRQRIQGNDTDQEGTQGVTVCQGGAPCSAKGLHTGSNFAGVVQALQQQATAQLGGLINQKQQKSATGATATIGQQSDGGRNDVFLRQPHSSAASVGNGDREREAHMLTGSVTQSQGNGGSGLHGTVGQDTSPTGINTNDARQDERQVLQAPAGVATQTQMGPAFCCATQNGSGSDKDKIVQITVQSAKTGSVFNPAATQNDEIFGHCDTTGNCDMHQQATQQGRMPTSNDCTGTFCVRQISCAEGSCVASTPDLRLR